MKCKFPSLGKGKQLKVKSIKDMIVIIDKKRVLARFNKVELISAGTIRKIINGLVTPPVKYIKTAN